MPFPWKRTSPPYSRARAARRRAAPPGVERLEERCLLSYRTITGYGNNPYYPTAGQAGTDLVRASPVAYADGISAPSLPQDASARAISNTLNDQSDPADPTQDVQTVNRNNLTDFGYVWGQFIDHDMDLTPDGGAAFNIPVDPSDPIGPAPLPFSRSQFDPRTGTSRSNPRQQINVDTAFLDLSQVYGSDDAKASALRTHAGGKLKTSPGDLLPYNAPPYFATPIDRANDAPVLPDSALVATGDRRGNENVELTALQTLFLREHNHLADLLHAGNPGLNDEQLYQEARKLNIAEEELITYNYYLPDVLGPNALGHYTGYNPNVNPAIATEFSTVGFRFGHSMLSNMIQRHGDDGADIPDVAGGAALNLATDFFDPAVLNPDPNAYADGTVDPLTGHTTSDIGPILKGDADGNAQATDLLAVNEIRNLLFGGGQGGQDLMARDLQRARDHGIGSYNQVRVAYGLPAVSSFAQITSNVQAQQALQQAYGSVANIDPFEGGLAEDHVAGADVGPLFQRIMVNQFLRLAVGDRYFVGNELFSQSEADYLNATTLGTVIERNTGVRNLQGDVFVFRASISGTVFYDFDGDGGPRQSFEPGLQGYTVELLDGSGDVLATTVTDANGNYTFTQQSGPSSNPEVAAGVSATGDYDVAVVPPAGMVQTTADPFPLHISRGDTNLRGVDLGVNFSSRPPGGSGGSGSLGQVVSLLTSPAAPAGPGAFVQAPAGPTAAPPASAAELTATGLPRLLAQGLPADLGAPPSSASHASSPGTVPSGALDDQGVDALANG
jgi:hypothetical protein